MQLHTLSAPPGASKKRKRRGRGESSGLGKTAGRGGKGQTARTGKGKPGLGFEGGQMPMYRRMPKRGFVNAFRVRSVAINLDILCEHFAAGAEVTLAAVVAAGLAARNTRVLRILGRGECRHALKVLTHHTSASAKEKIEAAGGRVELIGSPGEA